MIKITFSEAAYAALASSMPGASLAPVERCSGGVWVWLPRAAVRALDAARGAAESYSDLTLGLAALEQEVR